MAGTVSTTTNLLANADGSSGVDSTFRRVGDIRVDSLDDVAVRRAFRKIAQALLALNVDEQDLLVTMLDSTAGVIHHTSFHRDATPSPYPALMIKDTTSGVYDTVKVNLTATTDPTAADDTLQGYGVGSIWINITLDKVFVCLDASAGTWREYGSTASSKLEESSFDLISPGYSLGEREGRWIVKPKITAARTALFGELVQCDPTTAGFTVTLPACATTNKGRTVVVKNTANSVNVITVATTGADTIDGAASFSINAAYMSLTFVSNGITEWMII